MTGRHGQRQLKKAAVLLSAELLRSVFDSNGGCGVREEDLDFKTHNLRVHAL